MSIRKQLIVLVLASFAPGFHEFAQQPHPERNVYFGKTNVHTSWSFDAFAFGATVGGPEEFYQYALGKPTLHPGGFKQTISKPLDWAGDTEPLKNRKLVSGLGLSLPISVSLGFMLAGLILAHTGNRLAS